ncbi:glycosyltransferase family 1 protein [Desulfosporosinus sp. BG]|nr:glycosyltransferase family 1 protein [Desulfosporosinus sp. BG]ODA40164.1 hypothetical protein DSBG_3021 [Desulfosporosinus sp. BG]
MKHIYNSRAIFIAYGDETKKSKFAEDSQELQNWYKKMDLRRKSK